MKTNIKIKRVTESLLGTKACVIFERKNCAWMICVSKSGYYFSNSYNSDFICIYDDHSWACNFPERLPKYAKEAFDSLLRKYGEDYLKQFRDNLGEFLDHKK